MSDDIPEDYEFVVDRYGRIWHGEPKLIEGTDNVYVKSLGRHFPLFNGELVIDDDMPFFFYRCDIEV